MAMADTTPSKVYDIAEKLGYEGARTQSSAKAINACADALGFVGPHARRITDALSDLYTVVSGGGGGVDLGALQAAPMVAFSTPEVGNKPDMTVAELYAIKVGDTVACFSDFDNNLYLNPPFVAAGMTLVFIEPDTIVTDLDAYIVTLDFEGKIATLTAWDGAITKTAGTIAYTTEYSFVMPVLEAGTYLLFATVGGLP